MNAHDIIRLLHTEILGKYMKKYITNYAYPVITGGASVSHCERNTHTINDIDIVFAITKPNPTAELVNKVVEDRDNLLNNILADEALKGLPLSIRETYQIHPEYDVSAIKLVRVKFEDSVIIDTTVQSNKTNRVWNVYSSYLGKGLTHPIPYVIDKGVVYATCGFAKYDSLRILFFFLESENWVKVQKYLIKYLYLSGNTHMLKETLTPREILQKLRSDYQFVKAERKMRSVITDFKTNVILK